MARKWTQNEDNYLRGNYRLPHKLLSQRLNRSIKSIIQHKRKLGLRKYIPKKYNLAPEVVNSLYWEERLPLARVGERLNVPPVVIQRFMLRQGIPIRNRSEAHKLAYKEGRSHKDSAIMRGMARAKEFISLYNDGRSVNEIASNTGFNYYVIDEVFKRMGFKRRSHDEALRISGLKHRGLVRRRGGYITVKMPEHPRATKQGYVPQHILVWEEHNQRALPEDYVVHHLNGDKYDNRPVNLLAVPKSGHSPSLTVKEVQKRLREVEAKLAQQKLEF